jgi:hypothetical protein
MLSYAALENAIVSAVKTASGYASGQVFLSDQSKSIPSGDYIRIRFGDIPESRTAVPSQSTAYSPTPAGAEITHTYRLAKEFTVTLEVITASVTGDSSALAIAAKVQNNLNLSTVRATLKSAGLGLLSTGGVKYVPAIKGTRFEARALVEPRFYLIDTTTETTTYIETITKPLDYTQPPLGNPDTIDI